MEPIRCTKCGVAEGEPIEEFVPFVGLGGDSFYQPVHFYKQVVRTAYFDSEENANGDTAYICTECGHKFTLKEATA